MNGVLDLFLEVCWAASQRGNALLTLSAREIQVAVPPNDAQPFNSQAFQFQGSGR